MKKLVSPLFSLAIVILFAFSNSLSAQSDYKHPQINSVGQVLDENGTEFGWIKEGVIYNTKGEKVGIIENQELLDPKGKQLGTISNEGTFYDPKGIVMFTIEQKSIGEDCQVLDPQGKVIAIVHEGYKNQACAFRCLGKRKEPNKVKRVFAMVDFFKRGPASQRQILEQ